MAAVVVMLVLLRCGGLQSAASAATTGGTYNVLSYGAVGDGVTDNTHAFRAAIAAAEHGGGGEVIVPAGTFAFDEAVPGPHVGSVTIIGKSPVRMVGAGRYLTTLVEHVASQPLVYIRADGSEVEQMTIDSETYGGGVAVTVRANNTLLEWDQVFGANKTAVIGSGADSPFALYYPGPAAATPAHPLYDSGNQLLDLVVTDGVNNDGISFSFQEDGTISHMTLFGSRLAMYVDSYVAVTNYSYTPNPVCLGATDGFYIGSPSDHITIANFVTSGQGGKIGGPASSNASSAISIVRERFTSPSGFHLEVGNVNGLSISGGTFNTGNVMLINPPTSAVGITVQRVTIPGVQFSGYAGHSYSSVQATFDNDLFPALVNNGKPLPTFDEISSTAGPTQVTINDGRFLNQAGGLYKGTHTTFAINALRGYAS